MSNLPATNPNVAASGASDTTEDRIGLIAGNGRLPFVVAEGIHKAGKKVCAIGLRGACNPSLREHCDTFKLVGLVRIGQWIRTLRRWGISEAVMIGGVSHTRKYAHFQFLRYIPDWRAAVIWYRHLRHDRRTATMLTVLADELAKSGVTLIDNREYIPDHLAGAGVMTRNQPGPTVQRDIEFGWDLLSRAVDLQIGQAMAVRACDVIAVEAAEGTNAMIDRAGTLCGGRPWVLLKTASRAHDMRADVPTVGIETIDRLHARGGAALVLGAGRVIMVDRPKVVERAEALGIAVVGMEMNARRDA